MKAEAFCGEKTFLSATSGRLVVLHPVVAETEELSIILWIRDDLTEIATIRYLNESADIQNNGGDKVDISRDGSLTINNFTMEDQGTYIVVIKRFNQSDCKHMYDVSMPGIIPERAKPKTVNLFSYEEQKVALPLPKHLVDQVEDIFWMKDYSKHISTTFKNGSLHVLDSRYQGRLYSTSNGSLIIHDLRVEDRGKYSADIHLTNKELYTQIYHLSIYRKSYYTTYGTWNVGVTEGEDLILQNDVKEIKSIDWLTPRFIRFAVTTPGRDICILDRSYSDRLSSLKDGSITIKRVTKQDKGIYRAHMFSHNGMLLEQQYHVHIYEDRTLMYVSLGVAGPLVLIVFLMGYYCFYWMTARGHVNTYEACKTENV